MQFFFFLYSSIRKTAAAVQQRCVTLSHQSATRLYQITVCCCRQSPLYHAGRHHVYSCLHFVYCPGRNIFELLFFIFCTKMVLIFMSNIAACCCWSVLFSSGICTQQYRADRSISTQYSSVVRFSQSTVSSTYLPAAYCCRDLAMPREAAPTLAHCVCGVHVCMRVADTRRFTPWAASAWFASSNRTTRAADRGSSFGATYNLQIPRSVNGRLANANSEVVQDKGCRAPHAS